ncbi:hypothetical protein NKF06_20210, partial [Haloferax sp. AB510]|uniref:hypothetical protein n=1 Tax=Haloferax sp. AB510 TaxID=2934172 RepID=UPI00209C622C
LSRPISAPSSRRRRLHCIVSVHGDAEDMPWSDTKDTLDGTQQVTEEILNVAENALKEYRRQTYHHLPDWILSTYSLANLKQRGYYQREGIRTHPEFIDKSNSKTNSPRFNRKPGERVSTSSYRQFPVRDRLVRTAFLHGALRIRCDEVFEDTQKPAYANYFDEKYSGPEVHEFAESDLPVVEDYFVPLKGDDKDTPPLVEDIKKLAAEHASNRRRLTSETVGVDRWLLPRYTEELQNELDGDDIEELSPVESFDLGDWRRDHSVSDDVRVDELHEPLEQRSQRGSQPTSEPTSRPETSSHSEEKPSSRKRSATQRRSTDRSTDQVTSDTQREETKQGGASQSTITEHASAPSRSAAPTKPTSPSLQYGGEHYELDDEEVSRLLERLELDEDAEPKEIVQSVFAALESRERIADQLRELSQFVNIEGLLGEPLAIETDEE